MQRKCGGEKDCLLAYAEAKLLRGISPLATVKEESESCCNKSDVSKKEGMQTDGQSSA